MGRPGPASQPSDAVSSTASSVTLVQVTDNGPALMLSPAAQDTLASPTPRVARPSCVPANSSVVPKISAVAPSPESVAVQELVEQDTLSEVNEQPASGTRTIVVASAPAAIRAGRAFGVEDMARA